MFMKYIFLGKYILIVASLAPETEHVILIGV